MNDDALEVDDGEGYREMGELLGVPIHVDASMDPGEVKLEVHKFQGYVRVPKRVWSVTFPETGERWECRSLRKLLWMLYEPSWLHRLRWAVMDAWWEFRHGKEEW